MKFASDMFYESTVRKPTNEIFTVSEPQFPLVFVCTGTEHIKNYKQTVNATEAFILMNMLQKQNKNTDKTVCVMSSSRGQVGETIVHMLAILKILHTLHISS